MFYILPELNRTHFAVLAINSLRKWLLNTRKYISLIYARKVIMNIFWKINIFPKSLYKLKRIVKGDESFYNKFYKLFCLMTRMNKQFADFIHSSNFNFNFIASQQMNKIEIHKNWSENDCLNEYNFVLCIFFVSLHTIKKILMYCF